MNLGDFISRTAVAAGPDVIAWTVENRLALAAWRYAEGSEARANPWDSTLYVPGAWAYNTFGPHGSEHVWNYPSAEKGIFAFLATLHQPWVTSYAPIRGALHAGHDAEATCHAVGNSVWGTNGGLMLEKLYEIRRNPAPFLAWSVPGT